MENYEKKYNEALERAKVWATKYIGDWTQGKYTLPFDKTGEIAKEFLDIFNLRESEDERIRKGLRNFIELLRSKIVSGMSSVALRVEDMETFDSWIAYLDKQKEQTKEKKEYVRTLHSLISDFLYGKQEIDREYYQRIWEWLEGRHIEQKLAEWSEEDEKQIRQILRILNDCGCSEPLQDKVHNWFKSLRPKWKPSKEQLGSLRLVIEGAERAQMEATHRSLVSLMEDLKKL